MKYPPFDTVSTAGESWMIDNVCQVRIKCMFETINRTRSLTSNTFWQRIKQSNGMPHKTCRQVCEIYQC